MSEDDHPAHATWCYLFLLVLGTLASPCTTSYLRAASVNDPPQTKTGTVIETHSDKKVVQAGRWMVVRQFTVNVEVKCSDRTYCGEVTTTAVNEVDDLMASKGQSVECAESGHNIDLTLKNGRRVKAHQVDITKCGQN